MTGTEWYATVFAFAESPLLGATSCGRDRTTDSFTCRATAATRGRTSRRRRWRSSRASRSSSRRTSIRRRRTSPPIATSSTTSSHTYSRRPISARTWTRSAPAFPTARTRERIREDPVRRGLLYAGTETGVYYSTDDGAHWEPLQLNLPRASVRDLTMQGSDLIAATHGRAMWVLDDVSPLRHTGRQRAARGDPSLRAGHGDSIRRRHLPRRRPPARIRRRASSSTTGSQPRSTRATALRLEFRRRDRQGDSPFLERAAARLGQVRRVRAHDRRFGARAGHESGQTAAATRCRIKSRGSRELRTTRSHSSPSDSIVTMRAGLNRFVWDLRLPATRSRQKTSSTTKDRRSARVVAPGALHRCGSIGKGQNADQPFVVRGDPRLTTTQAEYDAQLALALDGPGEDERGLRRRQAHPRSRARPRRPRRGDEGPIVREARR